jgi:hypothetical protein
MRGAGVDDRLQRDPAGRACLPRSQSGVRPRETRPDNLVIDSLAETCASEDLIQLQHLFTDDRFAVPETITSFIEGVPTKIAWHPAKW